VDPAVARNIAHRSHAGQRDRFGEPTIEHVERVAGRVDADDRAIAYLHDVLEHTDVDADDLIAQGLTPAELAILDLLSRSPGESYEAHVLRIAHASGRPGRVARRIKLADLEDHLGRNPAAGDAPPYAWARMHVLSAQTRRGEWPTGRRRDPGLSVGAAR
jgi:hypothetical protein